MKKYFSKPQQNRIKKLFGRGYAKTIAEHLKSKEIYNTDGAPYSDTSVRYWLNTRSMNEDVYLEILELYALTKSRHDKLLEKGKETLK